MIYNEDVVSNLDHTLHLKYYVNSYQIKDDHTIILIMSNKIKNDENLNIFSDIQKVQRSLKCRVMNYFLNNSSIGTPYKYTDLAN
ncbi:MAG: hypothetical protein KDD94_14650 [Calditrichaeota bacterium]|nr:hypothetical protein [Calditrichota bacterium]